MQLPYIRKPSLYHQGEAMRGFCYLAGVFFLLSLSFFTCLNADTGNPDECLATIEAPDEVCLSTNFQVKITMTSSGDQVHDVDVSVAGITCDFLPKKAKCPGVTTIIVSPKSAGTATITCLTATKKVVVITDNQADWTVVQTGKDPLPPSSTTNYNNGAYHEAFGVGEFAGINFYRGSGHVTKTYGYDEGEWKPSSTGTGCGEIYKETFTVSVGFNLLARSPGDYAWITVTASGSLTQTTEKWVGEPKRHVRVSRVTPYELITDYRDKYEQQVFKPFTGFGDWKPIPAFATTVAKTYLATNYRVEKKCCEQ